MQINFMYYGSTVYNTEKVQSKQYRKNKSKRERKAKNTKITTDRLCKAESKRRNSAVCKTMENTGE